MKPFINTSISDLTSYDLLKILAVFTMVIDHAGYYFFPEQMEWRAVGRMSMPIWLFLVGYANTRDIPPILWGGAFVLLASYLVMGNPLLALNILFTIIITRAVLDVLARFTFKNFEGVVLSVAACVFLTIPTAALFDYGALAFMWALCGYLCRHHKEMGLGQERVLGYFAITVIVYLGYQSLFFGFNGGQTLIMVVGVLISSAILFQFKPVALTDITQKIPAFALPVLKFMGRRTLYIYVGHLILFLMIAFFLYPDRFGLFHLKFY